MILFIVPFVEHLFQRLITNFAAIIGGYWCQTAHQRLGTLPQGAAGNLLWSKTRMEDPKSGDALVLYK